MTWRLAESLTALRAQVNEVYPNRRKSSDGTIGDEAHASRSSDHNPWIKEGNTGIVSAIDFTHDPAGGVDARKLAEALVASRDPRIKYVISNRQICSGDEGPSPWKWRAYTGTNPHDKHMHLSVKAAKSFYDGAARWKVDFPTPKTVALPKDEKPIVKSKIATGSTTIGATETIDAGIQINDALDKVTQAKAATDNLGLTDKIVETAKVLAQNPRFWVAVVIVGICAGIVYWRWRDHGWGR